MQELKSKEKNLGVIGLGAIGVQVANAAVALGMDVLGYDPYLSVNAAWNVSTKVKHVMSVEDIYKECDFDHNSCTSPGFYKRNDQQRSHRNDERERNRSEFCKRYTCR